MGRIIKGHHRCQLRQTPYPIPANRYAMEKIDWEQAICSVCLEAPHNTVLLLCSSHDKGCRPYMCGTSFRHSNCLDLFKKAYAKPVTTASPVPQQNLPSLKKSEPTELSCPLCRGEVKGWTVVKPARQFLNKKKRSCMQDGCSFTGTFKELKKHVKFEHRRAEPRKVDPVLEAKWRALEMQTEQQDVMSTIRSSMPGSVVLGDYVIDMDSSGSSDFDDEGDDFDDDDGDDGRNSGGAILQTRRSRSRDIRHRILYFLLHEGARLGRIRRDNVMHEEGRDNVGVDVGHQSEENNTADGGRGEGRSVNLVRDGRRRQRRRQVRGRSRSVFGPS